MFYSRVCSAVYMVWFFKGIQVLQFSYVLWVKIQSCGLLLIVGFWSEYKPGQSCDVVDVCGFCLSSYAPVWTCQLCFFSLLVFVWDKDGEFNETCALDFFSGNVGTSFLHIDFSQHVQFLCWSKERFNTVLEIVSMGQGIFDCKELVVSPFCTSQLYVFEVEESYYYHQIGHIVSLVFSLIFVSRLPFILYGRY